MIATLVSLVLAQAFDPQEVGDAFGYPETASCQPCHPRHYEEWLASVHAASRRPPLSPAGSFRHPPGKDGSLDEPLCRPCHSGDPQSAIAARRPGVQVGLAHAAERAVTCTVCHQFAEDRIPRPQYDAAGKLIADPRPLSARRDRRFHEGLKPVEQLRGGALCGPCHQVVAPNGVEIDRTYAQYLASPYTARDTGCITCHMESYGGAMVPDGIFHGQLHRHDVIGVDVATNPVPSIDSQLSRVTLFLRSASALFVEEPVAVVAGRALRLPVEVVNSGAGHNFPAGPPGARRLWLEVDARLDDGRQLLRSGASRAGELDDDAGATDEQLVDFTDRFVDADGREVPFWWQAARVEERSLRALERRRSEYAVDVPEDARGRSLHLEVRLRFHARSPRQQRLLGLEFLAGSYPIIDVHVWRSRPIPVVERAFPLDVVVVPDDAALIEDALRRAPEGGTVLVRPGSYTLARALRFEGRRITLRSLEGPERTTLRRAADDAGSVLVFDGGEGPETRVEGFTLTGGRGTLFEGRSAPDGTSVADAPRHGGAVFCRGSGPTLAGNRIIANRATGDGGGVYLLDSTAVLEENVIEGNSAGGSGGGIAVAGRSGVTIDGGTVAGNHAGARGGGIGVVAAKTPADAGPDRRPVRIAGCVVEGNAAPLGGGIALEGPVLVERTLIAGNRARAGGGLIARGDPTSELENVTIVENAATQGGAVRARDGAPRFRHSILWGNEPADLAGVPGIADALDHCLVGDASLATGTNFEGLPLFERFPGAWTSCESLDEIGCVPVRWARGRASRPIAYGKWAGGRYRLVKTSPGIDAGAPDATPDPDGTRRDLGAFWRPQRLRGFMRGDVDGDGRVDLRDFVALCSTIQRGEVPPCADALDIDDHAGVDPGDALALLFHLFAVGPPPAEPYPACGIDPTPEDGVGCFESHSGCP